MGIPVVEDQPMFPLPKMDLELRNEPSVEEMGAEFYEEHDGRGCLVVAVFLVIFWAAVIATVILSLR